MSRLLISIVLALGASLFAGPFAATSAGAAAPANIAIIPQPTEIKSGDGSFTLGAETVILATHGAEREAAFLARMLAPATGLTLPIQPLSKRPPAARKNGILLQLLPSDADCGEEGYRLHVSPADVTITAAAPAGLFYGIQTLRQLLPVDIDSPVHVTGIAWTVPCVQISDRPRFPWRGFMLDSCRHFQSVAKVKQVIDLLARYKLNRLHWHLTEDEAWRIEVPGYPRLTAPESQRTGAERGKSPAGHDGFYAAAEVKEIVAYARERYVTVYPEVEMPGHSTAAIRAYPQLGCDGKAVTAGTSAKTGGDANAAQHRLAFCPARRETCDFLQDVALKVSAMFDAPYFHIGADEVPREQWSHCSRCRALIQAEKLTDNVGLQQYFEMKMAAFLQSHGKQTIYWGVDLERGIPPGIIVQGWHPGESLLAARKGFRTINSDCYGTYLDYCAGPGDVGATWPKLPLEAVYAFDPVPSGATAAEANLVLGSETPLWTEQVPEYNLTKKMFPRLFAFAEVVWSPKKSRDLAALRWRIASQLARLDRLSVPYYAPPVPAKSRAVAKNLATSTSATPRSAAITSRVRAKQ
jgi:hexosaminidase